MRVFTSSLSAVTLAAIVLYFCDIKYGVKIKKVFVYLSAALAGVLCFLIEFIFGFQYAAVALFFGVALFGLIMCKAKWISSVFSGILLSASLLFSQLCAVMIMSAIFNVGINKITSRSFLNVAATVFSLILFLTAAYIVLHFSDKSGSYSYITLVLIALPAASLLTTIVITKMYFSYKLNDEHALRISLYNLFLLISNIVVSYVPDSAV